MVLVVAILQHRGISQVCNGDYSSKTNVLFYGIGLIEGGCINVVTKTVKAFLMPCLSL